jgi:hypothetical protein
MCVQSRTSMTAKRRKEPPDQAASSPPQQADSSAQAPEGLTPKSARPRLSGEGADAALLHLIEREKLRTAQSKLP